MAGGWSARARMSGPLVRYIEGFEAELGRLGYTSGAVEHQLRLVAQLDGWLDARDLDAAALTAVVVEQFMAPRRSAGVHLRTARALEPLLVYLRAVGVAPVPAVAGTATPVERLLERYRRYLLVERGLAPSTVRGRMRIVGAFMAATAGADGLDLERLSAGDVSAFVVAYCRHCGRGGSRDLVAALRSLLGFLHVEGLVGGELAAAVPSVAGWRLAGLPAALAPGQTRLLLDSCDRETPIGRRDLAILTVLARLGLRRGEVAALTLDDIDWRAGQIVVTNGKRGRREPLPLPSDVGEAIASYLQAGRPPGALTRCVFVRVLAPSRGLTSGGVGDVVRAAGRRAGLGEIGAHRLRHTAATDVLRAGAGLQEVGQLLRHRLPRTTAIYAKVDLDALALIARPWPEAAS
jgi:site-specific recombinase XerD